MCVCVFVCLCVLCVCVCLRASLLAPVFVSGLEYYVHHTLAFCEEQGINELLANKSWASGDMGGSQQDHGLLLPLLPMLLLPLLSLWPNVGNACYYHTTLPTTTLLSLLPLPSSITCATTSATATNATTASSIRQITTTTVRLEYHYHPVLLVQRLLPPQLRLKLVLQRLHPLPPPLELLLLLPPLLLRCRCRCNYFHNYYVTAQCWRRRRKCTQTTKRWCRGSGSGFAGVIAIVVYSGSSGSRSGSSVGAISSRISGSGSGSGCQSSATSSNNSSGNGSSISMLSVVQVAAATAQ